MSWWRFFYYFKNLDQIVGLKNVQYCFILAKVAMEMFGLGVLYFFLSVFTPSVNFHSSLVWFSSLCASVCWLFWNVKKENKSANLFIWNGWSRNTTLRKKLPDFVTIILLQTFFLHLNFIAYFCMLSLKKSSSL